MHKFGTDCTVLSYTVIPGHIIAAAQLRWATDHDVPDQDSNQCFESGSVLDPDSNGSVGGSRQAKMVSQKRNFIFEEFSVGLKASPGA
jgi:hypothetical protein